MLSVLTLITEWVLLVVLHPLLNGAIRTFADVLLIGIFSIAFISELGKSRKIAVARTPLLLGYFWRLALMFWDVFGRNIYHLPGSGGDSEGYYRGAVQFAMTGISTYGGPFSKTMGLLYRWTGDSRLYGQFVVVLSSVLTLYLLYLTLNEIEMEDSVRTKTIGLIAFLPNYAILSSVFLRESFITMFCTLSFFLFVKWLKGGSTLYFVCAFASVFAASAFHSGVVGIAVGYIAVVLLYNRKEKNFKTELTNLVPAVLLIAVVAFLYINYGDTLFGKMSGIDSIQDISPGGSGAGAGGATYARYVGNSSTPLNMVIYTPLRIVFYLFSPFPWQWRGLSDIIAFVFSSCFYFWVVWRVIRYLRRQKNDINRYVVIAFFFVALCVVFVFSWGVTNTGTAIRHRDKVIALFAVLYALTDNVNRKWRLTWEKKEIL